MHSIGLHRNTIGFVVLVDEDARRSPIRIVELAVTQCPEERSEAGQAKQQRDGDKNQQPGHRAALARRNELAITITELIDMAAAAISGVTMPAIASGTASTL